MAAWPLVIFLLLPALTRAEAGAQAWVRRYNEPGNTDDQARAVVVDGDNNVVVTGSSSSGTNADYVTIKYSSAGVPLWTNRYNGPKNGADNAKALAVDANNNVIVTGRSSVVGSPFEYDYATIKYSSMGVPLWTCRTPAGWSGDPNALVVDNNNDVIVAGVASVNYFYTVKYSSEGVPLWTNSYIGPGPSYGNPRVNGLSVDSRNNVIVAGSMYGQNCIEEYSTIKLSSSGAVLWSNVFDCSSLSGMAVDSGDNVIVTGTRPYTYYAATIKYSSAGLPLWTNGNGGAAIAVDGSDNVILVSAGLTLKLSNVGELLWYTYGGGGTAVAVGANNDMIVTGTDSNGTNTDYLTVKLSSDGVPLWTNRYDGLGNGNDRAAAVALDRSGDVLVTGYSMGTGGNYEFATVKYVSVVPPPAVTGIQLTNGTFQMRVDDVLQPGTLVIEASTNLAGWAPVFTNTTPTNVLFYTDPDAGNSPTRFYRAFQFP